MKSIILTAIAGMTVCFAGAFTAEAEARPWRQHYRQFQREHRQFHRRYDRYDRVPHRRYYQPRSYAPRSYYYGPRYDYRGYRYSRPGVGLYFRF